MNVFNHVPDDQEAEDFPELVELPLEDVLDLHSFAPEEIKALVTDYLEEAYGAGFPEVRIIHGKGIGVQREMVRAIALRNPHVASVRQASEDAGSWGATLITFQERVAVD
ncbi:Smr protein/MutS2 [Candidatus Vecturithrix granuli]|uniref:Smr protein/MutS2 n=1 Tax=Vecturithrix granuli TaxID=1499967 RepID=A0A0S6WCS4_VECG1|nr:Smr protein/MutS2 [Candidatus Vecturithrix granuli]